MSPVWPCLLSFTCLVLSGLGEDYQTGGEGQCERPAGEGMIRADRPYYRAGDTLTVQCETGYRPSLEKITCTRGQTNDMWDHSPWCIGQCERPAGEGMIRADRPYYSAGDPLTVKCETGYRPSHEKITCTRGQTDDTWDHSPWCIAQCKHPSGEGMIPAEETYYNKGDYLEVRCKDGYRLSSSYVEIQCKNPRADNEWDHYPSCIAQCMTPQDTDKYTISGDKDSYDVGEYVTVQCKTGYRAVYGSIRCYSNGLWYPFPSCIERCKEPSISNLETVTPYREYYNWYEEVTLQCKPGYYPSPYTIYCTNNGERDVWTPTAVCIERCKEPSISNLETVTPYREYYNWNEKVTLQCKPGYYPSSNTIYCTNNGERDVWTPAAVCIERCKEPSISNLETVTPYREYYNRNEKVALQCKPGYYPSPYTIRCTNNGERDVWTPAAVCIVPNLPHIVKGPSMEDGRMRWSLLNRQGIVTGYKVEIAAWRDYDPSFSGNESHWLPPNVTECEILLQRGTNYTLTIRAMTSSGDGRSAVYMIETPPGGGRSNLTGPSDSNTSLDLASMLWLTVPILTVKLLILVVLLKIQFTLMAGKSPESDLVRHEELGNGILYRKREEGIVIL